MTPLEAPWRNGKTERAGKDWKEDNYKMTPAGPEAQTWTDFEEDCDAVNQARASKINDSGYSDGNEPCTTQRNITRENCKLDNLSGFWRRGANAAKRPTSAFWYPGVVISNTLATVWIAYRGSVVKCARSPVRPFTQDDEAAHEHITEHMRDLGERLLH